MADNTLLNAGTGGDTISTDDIGGSVKVQRVKVQYGADGSATDVSSTTPLPAYVPDITASGSLTSTASVTTGTLNGKDTAAIQVTGTWVATLQFEATVDGTNYFSVNAVTPATGILATSTTANGNWQIDVAGYLNFRVRCSAFTSGTAVVSISTSSGGGALGLDAPLPAGTNTIGAVNIAAAQTLATVTTVGTVTTCSTLTNITNWGNIVDDAAATPATTRVLMAGYFADDTATDSVDEGDGGFARMTLNRKQISQPYESEANTWSYPAPAGGLVSTTGVTAKAAAGAGLRNYITSIQVTNSHQSTGTEVLVRDGAAGTVLHRGWANANSGYTATFPIALRGTANTLVEIAEVTTTATAGVLVNLQGYVGA